MPVDHLRGPQMQTPRRAKPNASCVSGAMQTDIGYLGGTPANASATFMASDAVSAYEMFDVTATTIPRPRSAASDATFPPCNSPSQPTMCAGSPANVAVSMSQPRPLGQWLTGTGYTVPAAFTLGTAPRTDDRVRGPHRNNIDLALAKT